MLFPRSGSSPAAGKSAPGYQVILPDTKDIDARMRIVFTRLLLTLLGVWITSLKNPPRLNKRKNQSVNEKPCFLLFFLASLLISVAVNVTGRKENLMRSNGRIYVVIAVIVTILAGLLLYVFSS